MNNLLDLSGKIDPLSAALFTSVSETAGSLGIAFFVVGATARDMIFVSGKRPQVPSPFPRAPWRRYGTLSPCR